MFTLGLEEESFSAWCPAVITKLGNTSPIVSCFRYRSFLLWDRLWITQSESVHSFPLGWTEDGRDWAREGLGLVDLAQIEQSGRMGAEGAGGTGTAVATQSEQERMNGCSLPTRGGRVDSKQGPVVTKLSGRHHSPRVPFWPLRSTWT